jgi:hypothetical protein
VNSEEGTQPQLEKLELDKKLFEKIPVREPTSQFDGIGSGQQCK